MSGVQGPMGFQGTQGVQGNQGNQGKVGNQGDIGDMGLQGPIGESGIPGGQGPTGPKGDRGLHGPVGSTGSQGNQGEVGSPGRSGSQGKMGLQGSLGPQGRQGIQGSIGPATAGNQGYQGSFDNSETRVLVTNIATTSSTTYAAVTPFSANIDFEFNGSYLVQLYLHVEETGGGLKMQYYDNNSTKADSTSFVIGDTAPFSGIPAAFTNVILPEGSGSAHIYWEQVIYDYQHSFNASFRIAKNSATGGSSRIVPGSWIRITKIHDNW